MDVADRLVRLRALLEREQLDALVVSSLANIRYLTAFAGSAGLLFVLPSETVLLTDGRYETQSAEQLGAAGVDARIEVARATDQPGVAGSLVDAAGLGQLALEAAHVSWARQQDMAERWFPGVSLESTVGLVETLRLLKDPGEIARIGRAAEVADEALAAVVPALAEGVNELEVAQALDAEMRRLGAVGPSFDTIVAAGPNSAKPHHHPTDRPIEPGELVVVDFGAVIDGYCSDMTRTLWAGEVTDPLLRRLLEVVTASQAAGVAAVSDGVDGSAVDSVCRAVIEEAGWADRFVHGTGHGVGLDIHEAPSLAGPSTDTLRAGQVVTVEPGVYLPGVGGARVEDTLVVTDGGSVALTGYPKRLPSPLSD